MNLIDLLFRNIAWKLLSLLLASLVWIAVSREPELAAVVAAPVQFKNSPQNLEISSDVVESVDLETRGPAGLLRNLSDKRVAIVLDFSDVREPSERTFTIDRKNTNLPRGVELTRAIPSQLRYRFEPRFTRNVPVEPQFSGALPSGMHIVSAVASPAELAVMGPESTVRNVLTVRTDSVNLSKIHEDASVRVSAYLPNSRVRFQGSPEVTVRVSIGK